MPLSDLHKTKAQKVMGIDCSTKSIAFTIFDGENFYRCGEVNFNGETVFDRTYDAHVKTLALFEEFTPDFVAIEAAIMVRSTSVAIKMAYVFGAVIAALLKNGAKVIEVPPMSWQSFIGNKILTKAEKDAIKAEFPGKSASWYQNKGRQIRKQRTITFAKEKFGIELESDNVADSLGIGWWAVQNKTRRS
ncbi:RuvC-like resolvase [Streptomyces phage StarPlatinum]|uniref:RuvC-like resolvase n=1 Tax=Streptomyces phage StarPlatinum TaxID=2283265 RepID=A0A345M8M0_9CAUD|nr:crossover junction endodeoxyribonuclease RuvC [Streptomyces phage StarPlatinum]AXH66841.1 RuvC-like resolvase [Streptomyces phage StarPlatinum]